jgi:hypothetical protein
VTDFNPILNVEELDDLEVEHEDLDLGEIGEVEVEDTK